MKRVNHILQNPQFRQLIERINELEKNRLYCRHDLAHLLDVARLAYIISLENQAKIDKEVIYAAALLHDVGKVDQYLYGIPHELGSARIAPDIWQEAGYSQEEIKLMTEAVLSHRKQTGPKGKSLKSILYMADKKSRACFSCKMEATCGWSASKKNRQLKY